MDSWLREKIGHDRVSSMDDRISKDLGKARQLGVETCGRIAAFWGFTRTMGRVFGLLYLSPEPLSRADLERQLDISTGNASMTLAGLAKWGVVHKVKVPGRRGDRYRAETDFWKMIAKVLNERERKEIEAAVTAVRQASVHALEARRKLRAGYESTTEAGKEVDFVLQRLRRLQGLTQMGETMLNVLLGQLSLDVSRFLSVFRGETAGADGERSRRPGARS